MKNRLSLLSLSLIGVIAWLSFDPAFGQNGVELAYETRDRVVEGAKKEGRLVVSPGFEESTTPHLIETFKKKYPFIREVVWSKPADFRKQLNDLVDGTVEVDAFRLAPNIWSQYFAKNLLHHYDYKRLAQNRQLNLPTEMIDESGIVVWSGSIIGVMAYNTDRAGGSAPTNWESCVDAKWRGKFTVDSKPNVLASLAASWGEEKLLDYARRVKQNQALIVRGSTLGLTRLAAGEFSFMCGVYLHAFERFVRGHPSAPIKRVVANPVPAAFHEPTAVYARALHRHAALLWLEFLASPDGQQVLDSVDPGRASFLVANTLGQRLTSGSSVSICAKGCRDRENNLMKRIAVDAWGLPRVGE